MNAESDSDYKPVRPEKVVGVVVLGEIEQIEEIAEGCRGLKTHTHDRCKN